MDEQEAEKFREELGTKITGEDRKELMELQYQVGRWVGEECVEWVGGRASREASEYRHSVLPCPTLPNLTPPC